MYLFFDRHNHFQDMNLLKKIYGAIKVHIHI